jgi:hypothetical protein
MDCKKDILGPSYLWWTSLNSALHGVLDNILLTKDIVNIILEYIVPKSQFHIAQYKRFMIRDIYHDNRWTEIECMHVYSDQSVKIHYVGWNNKYDEILSLETLQERMRIKDNDLFEKQNDTYLLRHCDTFDLIYDWLDKKETIYVFDSCDVSCAANVLDYDYIDDIPYVYLRYIGWHETYDHWLCLWSNRIVTPGNDFMISMFDSPE